MSSSAIENNRNRLKGQKKNGVNERRVGKRLERTIAPKAQDRMKRKWGYR